MKFALVSSSTDGRYYKITFSFVYPARYDFLILSSSQNATREIILGHVNNQNNYNHIYFNSTNATYDMDTKTITVDVGANGWSAPILIYPNQWFRF